MSSIILQVLVSVCLVTYTRGHVEIYADDPYSDVFSSADFVPPEEPYTNLTMDQLISQAYGGAENYMSDYFMSPGGEVLIAEMDMRLDPQQFDTLYGVGDAAHRKKRKATRPLRYRWTNNLVPYLFAPGHFNSNEVYTIKKALQEWTDATCLTFRPATSSDRNKIRFQNGAGCNSALGMAGGTQAINLQSPGCRYKGLYLHEVGHALGLVHEHQLPDRDTYIYILYNNVSPSLRVWFNKYSTREVNQYGVPYEYSSVMHYGVTAFSVDGRRKTIQAKDPSKEHLIGKVYQKGLSFSDIKVVNLMYECNKHCTADSSCSDPGYLDKNCRCVCPTGVDCSTGGGANTTTSPGGTTPVPTSTTTPVIDCENAWSSQQCDRWAARGECDRNPDWMRVNCQRSCRTCPTAASTTTTTTTTTATTSPTTTTTTAPTTPTTSATTYMPSPPPSTTPYPDGNITTTTMGSTTTTYMPSPPPSTTTTSSTTQQTTTTTTTTTATTTAACSNTWGNYRCNAWSRSGECTRNPVWMRENCKRACNACSGGTGGGGDNCQNRHQNCSYWARTGYCQSSSYMTTNCRRACNLCS